jgi:nucleoside-diphosphate-sugar epimerase
MSSELPIIFLTGSNGFVGSNLRDFLRSYKFQINCYKRDTQIDFGTSKVVIHLAGIAVDSDKSSSFESYYEANTKLTKTLFDSFLNSDAEVFIFMSSVKAVAESTISELYEDDLPEPTTYYGKSKFLAEKYILGNSTSKEKRIYILRPCMIHGPGSNSNLKLLYKFVSKGLPWPFGKFNNKRSFCYIENLLFIIKELIERDDIPSGVYNLADDEAISTNELISLISQSLNRNFRVWFLPVVVINLFARIGDILRLPINSEQLQKLTAPNVVNNIKIMKVVGKSLPFSVRDGLIKTFNAFNKL